MLTPAEADAEDARLGTTAHPPPPTGTWPRMYAVVIVWQVVLVLALLAFQRAYS